jgi:uncharacterized protein (TIGR02147 family)
MKEQVSPRGWLENEFKKKRAKNSRYSLRMMARQLDLPSGRLSEIINGKRKVTRKLAEKIANRLSFTPEQREKFLATVERSKKSTDQFETPDYKQLSIDSFYLIADWYHFAILNLMNVKGFESDPAWIARRLGISSVEVKSAIDRLIRLGLIEVDGSVFRSVEANLTTTHDVDSVALKLSHKQSLQQAIEALDEVPVFERDITSITMAVDTSKLPLAKEMIRQFRRKLCALLENSSSRNEVYNLNVQLVPVSKQVKERKK